MPDSSDKIAMSNNKLSNTAKTVSRFLTIIILGALVGLGAFYILKKLGY